MVNWMDQLLVNALFDHYHCDSVPLRSHQTIILTTILDNEFLNWLITRGGHWLIVVSDG